MQRYAFEPDYRNVVQAARNEQPKRMPLYEHSIGANMLRVAIGTPSYEGLFRKDLAESRQAFTDFWKAWRTLGYDTASIEFSVCGVLEGGGALGKHKEGCIKTREDFDRYPWDALADRFFDRYVPYIRLLEETCPAGMRAVGGIGNGLFETVQDLVGYVDLCFLRDDDPALYEDLFARMGAVHHTIWTRFMDQYADAFCVLRFGDDLGFNTATLLSPDDIRAHVLPQYQKIVRCVHAKGKPFLLHSCGNLFAVFDDIIRETGIDAKHSNEDGIAHFSEWVARYGDRIGNFGGVDTDVLCRMSPSAIEAYVLDCLGRVAGHGGIAFGSGNSIPDYVPPEGYLAMVDTVRQWRGDRPLGSA